MWSNDSGAGGGVNWGRETLKVLSVVGKVALRVLSYLINIVMTVLLIGLITGIIVGTVFAIYINNYLDLEIDANLITTVNVNSTTRIYYMDYETMEDRQNRNGTPVEVEDQRLYGAANSIYVPYSRFPKNLVNAFIAIEDHRFKSHNGVDWVGTGRAVLGFFGLYDTTSGGSTITQQLVKNITGEEEVKIQRKIEEIFRALNLEKEKSKEEIMEMYLNIIFLGNGCDGVQAAANTYFGKDVSELSLVECAALAAIVKNPSQYEPAYHDKSRYDEDTGEMILEGNTDRRWFVLEQMNKWGFITEDEMKAAQAEELHLTFFDEEEEEEDESEGILIYNWYTESLISQIQEDLMEQYGISERSASLMILTGGLSIYTPMDPEVQSTLEEVYMAHDRDYFPTIGAGIQPQSAMVVCDPYTGDVLGLVGGRGEKILNRGTNRASDARRPPGSSIKPLSVYAPSLDAGIITYGTPIDDSPVMFNPYLISAGTESTPAVYGYSAYPHNLPDQYRGLTTVNSAIERSVNTVAMKVLQLLTVDKSFDFMKNTLHFDSLVEAQERPNGETLTDKGLAALALGQPNYGVTVLEMTAGYCMFQNHGIYNTPNLYLYVLDGMDQMLLDNADDPEIVISDETASIMTIMLQHVVQTGTASALTLKNTVDCAAKTGTTSADFDRYFVGYTPYYVGGVWTGYDIPQSLSAFGQSPSMIIWDKVMTMLHQKYITEAANGGAPLLKFERAPGVVEVTYCIDSGKLPTDACRYYDPRGYRTEVGYFTRETAPTEYCDTHVLVRIDGSTGLKATDQCPAEECHTTAFVRLPQRNFPVWVNVWDASYAYYDRATCYLHSGTGQPSTDTSPTTDETDASTTPSEDSSSGTTTEPETGDGPPDDGPPDDDNAFLGDDWFH